MQNEELWKKLEENYGIEKRWTLKEVAVGITGGVLYLLACGALYFVTVMAR